MRELTMPNISGTDPYAAVQQLQKDSWAHPGDSSNVDEVKQVKDILDGSSVDDKTKKMLDTVLDKMHDSENNHMSGAEWEKDINILSHSLKPGSATEKENYKRDVLDPF